jgi:hypothetical protein
MGRNARLGRVWRMMGRSSEAEQAGGRRIATVAGGCVVDVTLRADDMMKVVAVTSKENIRKWKNGH